MSARTGTVPARPARATRTGELVALWYAFVAAHLWLGVVALLLRPESSYDLQLYRFWVALGVHEGTWPVLDTPWVYPAGALVPMLVGGGAADSPTGYALAWLALVTALDALALAALLRAGRTAGGGGTAGAWWWLAALVALGPVAVARLDAVVAPVVVVALAQAPARPALGASLLAAAAWVKVAPGALVLALLAAGKRRVRVVAAAVAVSAAVVGAALALGSGDRVLGFLHVQAGRGLQVEAVAATPFSLARLADPAIRAELDTELNTFEIAGVDTSAVTAALDVLLPLGVAAVAGLAWARRRRGDPPVEVLLGAALALSLVLVVANKVGSPQFVAWLLPPLAVALAVLGPRQPWRLAAAALLLVAALTQWVYPFAYGAFLAGEPAAVLAAAVRNALLVALLAVSVAAPVRRRAAATPLLR